ncbi:hypothetical protein DRQ09_04845 [candidate division KSB1 bacterium]|nr:MAG: hypothetical protein DRQ09_04845 [candidate division KSB1 bacterium]
MDKIILFFRTTKKRYLLGIFIVIFVFTVYWVSGSGVPDIASTEVKYGEFITDIRTTGELQAHKNTVITVPREFRRSLQIIKLVEEGSIVKKGDFLVQFDTGEFEKQLEQKKNEMKNAEAEYQSLLANQESNMAQLKASLETQRYSHRQAEINLAQMKYEAQMKREQKEIEMKKADIALKQAEEKIKAQKIIDEADRKKAELKIKHAKLEVEKIEKLIKSCTITAPTPGLVVYEKIWGPTGRQKVKVGDTPWRGQGIISIPDLSIMQVKTKVNEVDISKVEKGQDVIIRLDSHPDAVYYGNVTEIANLARSEGRNDSKVKVFDVIVTIKESDKKLKPGMSATCQIITERIKNVLYIPLQSVFEKDGKTVVYVMNPGPEKRVVELGPKNSNYVVIKKGLKKGERVTLRDPTLRLEEIGKSPKQKIKKQPVNNNNFPDGIIIFND